MSDEEFEDEYYDLTDDESVASDFDGEFSLDEEMEEDEGEDAESDEESEEERNRAEEKKEQKERKKAFQKRIHDETDKLPRTIFVGNLPLSVTRKSVTKLFSVYGPVTSVRLRGAVPEAGKGRGLKKQAVIQGKFHAMQRNLYAYVVFKKQGDVAKACHELNGFQLDGRHLRVDPAMSGGSDFNSRHCIFVGGVPYVADEEALREHFSSCGDIKNIRLVRDACGAPKGIAFLEFSEEHGAVVALKKNGSEMNGRTIRVQRWSKKEQEKRNERLQRGKNAGPKARKGKEANDRGGKAAAKAFQKKNKKEGKQGAEGPDGKPGRAKRGKPIRIPTSISRAERADYVKQVLKKRRRQAKSKRKEARKKKNAVR